jgi:hypothetical protein
MPKIIYGVCHPAWAEYVLSGVKPSNDAARGFLFRLEISLIKRNTHLQVLLGRFGPSPRRGSPKAGAVPSLRPRNGGMICKRPTLSMNTEKKLTNV